MKINFLLLIFSLFSSFAHGQEGQIRREIPISWVAKLQKYDYKTFANDLVREFQTYIAPDSLEPFKKEAFLSPMFVNLDEDAEVEILLFIGGENALKTSYWYEPNFCVLKRIKKKWYLIHNEYLWCHNQEPEINVVNIHASNKLFYIRKLHEYGTGAFESKQHFYRLKKEKVQAHLEVVIEDYEMVFMSGYWSLFEKLQGDFQISPSGTISVVYNYILENQKGKQFLNIRCRVWYNWNENEQRYIPEFIGKEMNQVMLDFFLMASRPIEKSLELFKEYFEKLIGEERLCYEEIIQYANKRKKRNKN